MEQEHESPGQSRLPQGFLGCLTLIALVGTLGWMVFRNFTIGGGRLSYGDADHMHEFDPNLWDRFDESVRTPVYEHRGCMVKSLIAQRTLDGLEHSEVYSILGRPTLVDSQSSPNEPDNFYPTVEYYLGPKSGAYSFDSDFLSVEFSSEGKVNRVSLTQH